MSTISNRNLTLFDIAKRKDPDGKIANILELMDEDHYILEDMIAKECNDGTNHITTVRNGIPSGTWRRLYEGVQSEKSTTTQVTDKTGELAMMAHVDKKLIDLAGDSKNAVRMSEQVPFFEGLRQDVESTLFYGDTDTYPDRFMGFAPRYDVHFTSGTTTNESAAYNCLDGGGASSDNTSIFLVGWGDNTCFALYPRGTQVGIQHEDLGIQLYDGENSTGGKYKALVDSYEWDIGLCVRDWRAVGRICNIDVSNLEGESSAADLIKLMIKLSERVKGGKQVWYMHERVRTMLRIQMLNHSNVNLTFENVEGRMVMMFDGKPVKTSDEILLTESEVSADA